ncbi:MAG: septum site-determining protein MinC [Snowella sp.]
MIDQMASDNPIPPIVQIQLQSTLDKLLLILPPPSKADLPSDWPILEHALKTFIKAKEGSWQPEVPVHLIVEDRLLDVRQLQAIAEILEAVHLNLGWVQTTRRQTAIAAVTLGYSVDQAPRIPTLLIPDPPLAPPLYLTSPVRSGTEIRHPGNIILVGDVNPGGNLIANGDILIWGTLRGTAHAGAEGNQNAIIMILKLGASQLRIADLVARVSPEAADQGEPEVAYITPDGIRLASARSFKKIK